MLVYADYILKIFTVGQLELNNRPMLISLIIEHGKIYFSEKV